MHLLLIILYIENINKHHIIRLMMFNRIGIYGHVILLSLHNHKINHNLKHIYKHKHKHKTILIKITNKNNKKNK